MKAGYPNMVIPQTDASSPIQSAPPPGRTRTRTTENPYDHDLYMDFPTPVNNLTFKQMRDDASEGTTIGQVHVFRGGTDAPVATLSMHSTGDIELPGEVDLSAYHNVTRIEIVNVTDPAGLLYDDFTFDQAASLALTVTDHANALNHVTAITDAAIKGQFYVAADANNQGHVDLGACSAPQPFGGPATSQLVHLSITPSDPAYNSTYANLSAGDRSNIPLQATATVHDFAIVAWLDEDGDGIYDEGIEPRREVDVHVVTLDSLTMSDYDDSSDTVTTTDATTPELSLRRGREWEDSRQLCGSNQHAQ